VICLICKNFAVNFTTGSFIIETLFRSIPLLLQRNFLHMRPVYLIFSCCLFAFASCNNGNTGATTGTDTSKSSAPILRAPARSKLSDAGTTLLMSVVTKYYSLKNALVATKAPKADSAAMELATIADSLKSFLQNDTANNAALKLYVDTIVTQSKQVSALKDETCEKQRLAFGMISSAIYGLLKNVDMKNAGIYHEYCPMAFNEKGAFWLSDESEIKNPYFGKKMMECGEVTDSL